MIGRLAAFSLTMVFASLMAVNAAANPVATGIRIGQHGVETRVVVDLTDAVEFQLFRLTNPYRVAVDLPEIAWSFDPTPIMPENGVVDRIRFGQLRPGTSRLLLDLRGPYRVKDQFILPPGGGFSHRLVIDLAPVAAVDFEPATEVVKLASAPVVSVPIPGLKPRRDRPKVIIVDAGHGGPDPGAIGRSGTREKDIVLAAAREIRDRLGAIGRYDVILTRSGDNYLKLRERVDLARRAGGDLFISLHADSHPLVLTSGASVYTLSERASDAEAAALAEKENKSDIIAGFDLTEENNEVTNILIDLAQRETMNRSALFASLLTRELSARVPVLRRTHRFAGFAVLKAPDIPSVLLELGYLSNIKEERRLSNPKHRAKIVDAVIDAIETYFAEQQKLARS